MKQLKHIVYYLIVLFSVLYISYQHHQLQESEKTRFVKVLHVCFLINSAIAIKYVYNNHQNEE